MAKYSADIEIAVRGAQQVDGLIKNLNRLNNSINVVNRNAKLLEGKGFNVASMENYSRAVLKAENAIRKAAQGTQQEQQAVKALVTAMDAENKARARRNFLIAQEVASRRQIIATANAGFGMQGPQAAAVRAGRGPASPIRGTVNMPGSPAALAAEAAGAGRGRQGGRGISGRLGGAISGSIIGGAFPLLFGQEGGAAAGGAIGGLVGGLVGPGGSFAGSLLGTLLGEIASKGQKVKELAADIGFSAEQTQKLEQAFKQSGKEFDKFEASVQAIRGIGLSINEQANAIQAASKLAEVYGGKIDKIASAFATALSSGKVTQATLNQLTAQGIPIQNELANAYGVSRSELLKMAKDGEISVQQLSDSFVKLANESSATAATIPTAYETATKQIQQAVNDLTSKTTAAFTLQTQNISSAFDTTILKIGNAVAELISKFTPLVELVASVAADFINLGTQAASALLAIPGYVDTVINAITLMIPGLSSTLYILESIQNITGKGKGKTAGATPADYGRYAPGFMQEKIPTPSGKVTAPSQVISGVGASKASKEAEKLAKELERSLEAGRKLATQFSREVMLLNESSEVERQRLQIQFDYEDRAKQIAELKNAQQRANLTDLNNEIKRLDLLKLETAELKKQLDDYTKRAGITFGEMLPGGAGAFRTDISIMPSTGIQAEVDKVRQELDTLLNPINQVVTAAEGIGLAFSDSFKGIISGTMTAQEALAGFFQSIADQFLDMAAQIIAKWIQLTILNSILKLFPTGPATGAAASGGYTLPGGAGYAQGFALPSLIPGRAIGGSVSAGSPYIVGERGPELFVPGRSGTIVPNDKMGGNSVQVGSINISVENSGDTLSPQAQKQIAGQVRGIVLATLVDQQRSGGVLR